MKWLKKNKCKFDSRIFGTALNGNLDNMKWLKKMDVNFLITHFVLLLMEI